MPTFALRPLLLRLLPSHLLTRLAGCLADIRWPGWILRGFLHLFIRTYQVDMSESAVELPAFRTFTDFFTRPLREGVRPIDPDPTVAVSPVDGIVAHSGRIENRTLIQAKGHFYQLAELIPEPTLADIFEGGTFLTLYLSPRHYHRVHTPVAGNVQSLLYLPGTLFPVNPPATRSVPQLFARNERVLTMIEAPGWGRIALLMVGALIVGRMRVVYESPRRSFRSGGRLLRHYEEGHSLERGDELGRFELGSTVIVLWEPGAANLVERPLESEIRLGQPIAFPSSHTQGETL